MRRHLIAATLTLALGGCSTFFVPSYSEEIYKSIEIGNTELGKLRQAFKVDDTKDATGNLTYPKFEKMEPYWVATLAGFNKARELAEARPAEYKGLPAEDSSRAVATAISACTDLVAMLMKTHKEGLSDPSKQYVDLRYDKIMKGTIDTCGIPKTMEEFFKKSK